MRPSSRFTYALRALVDLALHQATCPVTVAVIAKRQGIPARSLAQIFNRLGRKGWVEAERGPRGGYRLRRPPGEIQVREIFDALQPKGPLPAGRGTGGSDPARLLWQQVEKAVRSTLEAATLETLVAQAREEVRGPIEHSFTFHI